MDYSIILPTFNEVDNIGYIIKGLQDSFQNESYELIIVDDGSTDGTIELVKLIVMNFKNIRLIVRSERGYTGAIKRGIQESKGKYIGWLDCDGSHPTKYFKEMIKELKTADVVIASRFIKGSIDDNKSQNILLYVHKILSLILSHLGQFFITKDVTDFSSGFIICKKEMIDLNFSGNHGEFFIELIHSFVIKKAKFKEVPFHSPQRMSGESKTATNFWELFTRGIKYLYKFWELRR